MMALPSTGYSIPAPDATGEEALACARRALISSRLPLFAAGWIGSGLALRIGLVARGSLSPRLALVSIGLQAAVLAVAFAWCRRSPSAARVPRIALGSCVLLILLAGVFFSSLGGSIEVFVFAALIVCIGSSLAFAWGWWPALMLIVASSGVGLWSLPRLHSFTHPTEILLEAMIGAGIALTIAEVSARSFERSFREAHTQREAGRSLAAAYAAYRDLAENAPDLIFTHDLDGHITYVNEAFARSCGVPAAELIGRVATDLVPRDPANPDSGPLRAKMAAGEDVPPQLYWVKSATGPRWLETASSAIRDVDGRIVGVRGTARDVTERHVAEEALRASLVELRQSEERLRQLTRHQASIREDERKRLGFDLHDDVCQELIGIGILVESVRQRVLATMPELDPDLARIARYVGEVGDHLRQMAHDLRPMLLRDLGLEESLQSLADAMTQGGTPLRASFPTAIPRVGEETEIGVYRIAQEALTNAVRHAGARSIGLTLAVRAQELTLTIIDDGSGFEPDARRGSDALGLVGMQERALALGGQLELRSAPGHGTTVRLICPVVVRSAASAA